MTVEALRQELALIGQALAARDEALCDLQAQLATLWDQAGGGRGPVARQTDAPLIIGDDLWKALPDLYDYMLQRDEEIRAAIDRFQASLAILQQHMAGDQAGRAGARLGHQEYEQLIRRIRHAVAATVAHGATVVVVSKGDNELLKLDGRRAWHFPQTEDGTYAGYHPASSAEAISHLEALRAKGAEYLLFPNTTTWWLDYYSEFRQHMERHYRVVMRQDDTCTIFELRDPKAAEVQTAGDMERLRYYHLTRQIQEIVQSLLPSDAAILVVSKGDRELLRLAGPKAQHFPQTEGGEYAGYYPADSAAAIAHLEALRLKGADYLLFPATAFWWLEHYREFIEHLEKHYRMVVHQEYCCLIFALHKTAPNAVAKGQRSGQAFPGRRSHTSSQ